MFWDEVKVGLCIAIGVLLLFITAPSAMGLGLYLMGKLIPQIAPTCEVRK
jgi:hypothetical protein